jgi:hypothetical protein
MELRVYLILDYEWFLAGAVFGDIIVTGPTITGDITDAGTIPPTGTLTDGTGAAAGGRVGVAAGVVTGDITFVGTIPPTGTPADVTGAVINGAAAGVLRGEVKGDLVVTGKTGASIGHFDGMSVDVTTGNSLLVELSTGAANGAAVGDLLGDSDGLS